MYYMVIMYEKNNSLKLEVIRESIKKKNASDWLKTMIMPEFDHTFLFFKCVSANPPLLKCC